MRLFIAIPLTDEVKQKLFELQQQLASSKTRLKPVEKNNLHITMRFIGDAEPQEWIKKIDSINEEPFQLMFNELGAFPSKKRIRVIWAGCEPVESLLNIHRVIGDGELVPHITLARVHNKPDKTMNEFLETSIDFPVLVDKIQLVNSTLTPKGPEYEVIHEKTF